MWGSGGGRAPKSPHTLLCFLKARRIYLKMPGRLPVGAEASEKNVPWGEARRRGHEPLPLPSLLSPPGCPGRPAGACTTGTRVDVWGHTRGKTRSCVHRARGTASPTARPLRAGAGPPRGERGTPEARATGGDSKAGPVDRDTVPGRGGGMRFHARYLGNTGGARGHRPGVDCH